MKLVSNEGVPKGRLQGLMEGRLTDGNGNVLYQTLLKYNGKNELSAFRENWNGKKYVTKYTYDHNGLRVKKVVNGVTTEYMLHGKLVTGVKSGSDVLKIAYDEQSRPAMVEYNGVWYGYVKDLQGDIVGIVDSNGTEVVKYSYDVWGFPMFATEGSMASTLGKANPFRYRGYVYDEETGLYYAQERYYNPEWCRFISADDSDAVKAMQTEQTDKNLYAYCDNNPIIREDKEGGILEFCSGSSGRSGDRGNDADHIECGIWQ